jgi:aminopeptidase
MDQRIQTLASNLVNYSTKVKEGDKVLIECIGDSTRELGREIIKEVYKAGGIPFIELTDMRVLREQLLHAPDSFFQATTSWESERMKQMDCYIGIRGSDNITELADVPAEQMSKYQRLWQKPIHSELRVKGTRWVVLRYPNPSMAQLSNTSTEAFEDFYFNVCTLDYSKMGQAMDSLVSLMNKTDKVRIEGPGTNLSFSIKDIPAIKCAGELNIPDGEVFAAPVLNSVNGTLQYNTPAVYQGFTYENIKLSFKDGKIIEASANDSDRLNKVFDTDQGARFIGEFAIGVNPYVEHPMKDTLFDEKIKGSFHFTPGQAYDVADNGNRSAIHWDLVCIQTEKYGGGKIYFDDILIRENGIFVLPELECLNPENLI